MVNELLEGNIPWSDSRISDEVYFSEGISLIKKLVKVLDFNMFACNHATSSTVLFDSANKQMCF